MAHILCVGIATLDIINHVERYPDEDSEVRVLAQQRRLGGNAANTATVLAQLGDAAAWVGNLGDQPGVSLIRDTFARYGVNTTYLNVVPGRQSPTSYVTLSRASGSRTIVHYRDLPEYPAELFAEVNLQPFDWIHFEGRAVDQLEMMLGQARNRMGLPVSLEVEKPREGIEALFWVPDLLLFSRDYVIAQGEQEPERFLHSLPSGLMACCTWGAEGAWARGKDGTVLHVEAYRPHQVVDTLGAGDVFNAGMLHSLSQGLPLAQALQRAVRLAGEQCGREGLTL